MKETEWAALVADWLNDEFSRYRVVAGDKLIYANEIVEYHEDDVVYREMKYETDIIIYEQVSKEAWKPRVVIETKVDSVSTHDAITYSQKASSHKYVHPYLRYGIFLGHRGEYPLPGRLFRHGAYFDFMLSWKDYEPTDNEWTVLIKLLKSEIAASKKLEEMLFNTRSRDRKKYHVLHKPLITKSIN